MSYLPNKLKSQQGVAMMMAMMTMTVLGILIAQMVYETEVYHRSVFNNIDKIRSHYLAKSALRMGILQIHAAAKAREKTKSMGASGVIPDSTIDMIWQTPMILPPPTPPDSDVFDKTAIDEFNKSLELGGNISVSIEGESQKLNLNDLVWTTTNSQATSKPRDDQSPAPAPAPTPQASNPEQLKKQLEDRRDSYKKLFAQMLDNRKLTDEKFEHEYHNLNGEELMQNIIAWIDPATENDGENRPKEEYYKHLTKPYDIKNAPFFSLSELFQIKGFDDEIAKMVHENFTSVLTTGININKVSATLLRSLIPTLTDRDVVAIETHKADANGGDFKDEDDFWKFLETLGDFKKSREDLKKKGIKFSTTETSYRVLVQVKSGLSARTWVAMVGDLPPEVASNTPGIPNSPYTPPPPPKDPKKTDGKDGQTPNAGGLEPPHILYLKAD